jgi:hypothetical protein
MNGYVSKKFFSQRSSWDEMWIFRGALNWMLPHALTLAVAAIKQAGGFVLWPRRTMVHTHQ